MVDEITGILCSILEAMNYMYIKLYRHPEKMFREEREREGLYFDSFRDIRHSSSPNHCFKYVASVNLHNNPMRLCYRLNCIPPPCPQIQTIVKKREGFKKTMERQA